jgi:hypothetical protein
VDLIALGVGVTSEQRLRMLPTRQAADFPDSRLIDDIEKRGSTAFSIDRSLDMRGLDLALAHLILPS